jgi:methionyl-tRNA formyltransferase
MLKQTICIAGKNSIAVNGLSYLLDNYPKYHYICIPNKNDDGEDHWQPSLAKFARLKQVTISSLDEAAAIRNLIFISLEFDRIIKPHLFQSKRLYNIHFSALPYYKGMYTSALPILHGEAGTGVTLHKIDHGIDTGEIIAQIKFPIDLNDTVRDLYFKYFHHGFELFKENIELLLTQNYVSYPQNRLSGSYYSKRAIDYSNIVIDFDKTAIEVHNQIRAFTFEEYQVPKFNGYPIKKTDITSCRSTKKPGCIMSQTQDSIIVSTIDYDIIIFI